MYNVCRIGDSMLGKIVGIQENTVYLKLNVNLTEMQSIINLYVLLEDNERKMITTEIDAVKKVIDEFIRKRPKSRLSIAYF